MIFYYIFKKHFFLTFISKAVGATLSLSFCCVFSMWLWAQCKNNAHYLVLKSVKAICFQVNHFYLFLAAAVAMESLCAAGSKLERMQPNRAQRSRTAGPTWQSCANFIIIRRGALAVRLFDCEWVSEIPDTSTRATSSCSAARGISASAAAGVQYNLRRAGLGRWLFVLDCTRRAIHHSSGACLTSSNLHSTPSSCWSGLHQSNWPVCKSCKWILANICIQT